MRFLVWLLYFSWSFISSFGWIYWDGRKGHGVFIQRWLIIRIKYWKHPYGQWDGFSAGVLFEGYPIQWNCRKWGTFVSFGRIRRPKHRCYWDKWCHWARNLNHHHPQSKHNCTRAPTCAWPPWCTLFSTCIFLVTFSFLNQIFKPVFKWIIPTFKDSSLDFPQA